MPPYQVRGRLLKSGMTEKDIYKQTLINSTQTHRPSDPTPTVRRQSPSTDLGVIKMALDGGALSLPLKGREIAVFLPLQGGGQEGDGVSAGVVLIRVCL